MYIPNGQNRTQKTFSKIGRYDERNTTLVHKSEWRCMALFDFECSVKDFSLNDEDLSWMDRFAAYYLDSRKRIVKIRRMWKRSCFLQ